LDEQIDAGVKSLPTFTRKAIHVVSRYRLEKGQNKNVLAGQVQYLVLVNRDNEAVAVRADAKGTGDRSPQRPKQNLALMAVDAYRKLRSVRAIEEVDFDGYGKRALRTFCCRAWALAWVRYDPEFTTVGEGDDAYEDVAFEGLAVDYVNYWKDFISDDIAHCGRKSVDRAPRVL
jgi:hypothetical protein